MALKVTLTVYFLMAMPCLKWLVTGLSQRRSGFVPRSVHVGFAVDKVATGHVFLRVIQFSSVNIFLPWLSILIYHLQDEE
jgi:hypothetical protein